MAKYYSEVVMLLPRLAIKNSQFTFTFLLLFVLVGLVSYFSMPRSEDPQFDLPITLIEVIYPGASSTDIEALVVDPIEQAFADIENIKSIESELKNDGARIEVKFHHGVDADASYNKIKQAVAEVKPTLPTGVRETLVLKATPKSVAVMQYALWTTPLDYKTMAFYGQQLKNRLEALNHVRKADLWGFPEQVVAVDVNLALLKHYGLSITDINQRLQGRSLNITPGFVDASTRRFNVQASGHFQHIDDLAQTVVMSTNDVVLRLKDIANITFNHVQPNYLAYLDQQAVIFLTVEQAENSNIFDLTTQIEAEVEQFKLSLPDNFYIDNLFKQADSVAHHIDGFFSNLWQGLLLVGIISLLFLGFREAFVVIMAIPLSFLIAIGWLDFSGFGLQQMSIVGLIIALGLLVDNAIVVTESIHRELKNSPNSQVAAEVGTSRVAWAIISGTLTTMLAFFPMLMLNSSTGDFIRSLPITVILVLMASLIIALTLTPILASKTFTNTPSRIKSLQFYINHFADGLYRKLLTWLIQFRWLVIAAAILIILAMFSIFGQVGVSLFPKAEKPMVLVDVKMPANSSLNNTEQLMHKVANELLKHEHVAKVALNVGNANPRIYYNHVPKRGIAKYGQLLVVLKEYNETEQHQFVASMRAEFSNWHQGEITLHEFTQGPVTDKPITIRLLSENLEDLERVGNDLASFMASVPGMINLENPLGEMNTELALRIDYDKAGLSNININTLDNTLQTILSGTSVGLFNDDNGENYPIVVRTAQPDITKLNDISVTNTNGVAIPMNQMLSVALVKGRSDFFHYQKLRMAKISADAESPYSISELTEQVVKYLSDYQLPQGMSYQLGGEEASRQENFSGLTKVMLITAVGIFAILVLQFNSFSQPMIIFTSIPFAMAGAGVGLYLTNNTFSMMAFIGLISLFGIVVNNAIILIDTTNRYLREGMAKSNAILDACVIRFTPILLTTLTTVCGLIPLTFLGGSLWQPLGVVIMAGLCVSALASFFLVPVLITLFTREQH